jgi:hypothetical protein
VETVVVRRKHILVASLEGIRRTPLDMITADQAAGVVKTVLDRESDHVAVDVARFGSAI